MKKAEIIKELKELEKYVYNYYGTKVIKFWRIELLLQKINKIPIRGKNGR